MSRIAVDRAPDVTARAGQRPRLEIQRFLVSGHPTPPLTLSEHYPRVNRSDGSDTPVHQAGPHSPTNRFTPRRTPRGCSLHAAQRHRDGQPNFITQSPLDPVGELDLNRTHPSPVQRVVLRI